MGNACFRASLCYRDSDEVRSPGVLVVAKSKLSVGDAGSKGGLAIASADTTADDDSCLAAHDDAHDSLLSDAESSAPAALQHGSLTSDDGSASTAACELALRRHQQEDGSSESTVSAMGTVYSSRNGAAVPGGLPGGGASAMGGGDTLTYDAGLPTDLGSPIPGRSSARVPALSRASGGAKGSCDTLEVGQSWVDEPQLGPGREARRAGVDMSASGRKASARFADEQSFATPFRRPKKLRQRPQVLTSKPADAVCNVQPSPAPLKSCLKKTSSIKGMATPLLDTGASSATPGSSPVPALLVTSASGSSAAAARRAIGFDRTPSCSSLDTASNICSSSRQSSERRSSRRSRRLRGPGGWTHGPPAWATPRVQPHMLPTMGAPVNAPMGVAMGAPMSGAGSPAFLVPPQARRPHSARNAARSSASPELAALLGYDRSGAAARHFSRSASDSRRSVAGGTPDMRGAALAGAAAAGAVAPSPASKAGNYGALAPVSSGSSMSVASSQRANSVSHSGGGRCGHHDVPALPAAPAPWALPPPASAAQLASLRQQFAMCPQPRSTGLLGGGGWHRSRSGSSCSRRGSHTGSWGSITLAPQGSQSIKRSTSMNSASSAGGRSAATSAARPGGVQLPHGGAGSSSVPPRGGGGGGRSELRSGSVTKKLPRGGKSPSPPIGPSPVHSRQSSVSDLGLNPCDDGGDVAGALPPSLHEASGEGGVGYSSELAFLQARCTQLLEMSLVEDSAELRGVTGELPSSGGYGATRDPYGNNSGS